MFKLLCSLKREQLIGLLLVLMLHAAALYGLWSYHIISTPDEAITLMVNLINPPRSEPPKPPKIEPPKQPHPKPVEPLKPQPLAADTSVVKPDEPVVYSPPTPQLPVVVARPLPPQPVMLACELSVSCPERSPPEYPRQSMRMNEEGKVVLRVELGEDGHITNAVVKLSSGYPRLDEAALSAIKTWRCRPSVQNGVAVRAMALQPFNFTLEGR